MMFGRKQMKLFQFLKGQKPPQTSKEPKSPKEMKGSKDISSQSPSSSPSTSTLSSSPSKMQPPLLKDKVVTKMSPLQSPSSSPSLASSPSPSAPSLASPSPSPSPSPSLATTPPLLQPNVVSGGGPAIPPPLMLQPNVEAAQSTEPQLPSPLPLLTNLAVGIPLPLPRSSPSPSPASLKPNVATGTPLLPPPSVPLQPKVVATRPPLPPLPPPPPPPPPTGTTSPTMLAKGPGPLPPPPPPVSPTDEGGAPPLVPPSAAESLRPKKTNTKLKISSQMGNLYRVLRGKLEGYSMQSKSSTGKSADGSISSRKQIEEDVEKYAKSIIELKTSISTFSTKDMTKLIKFHKHVESILDNLTDETQVLARFEGFPTQKLEALRKASELYSKFESMITLLQNLKIEPPLHELLDKVDRHFTKIQGEIDALELTKDEESKKFTSHDIEFDFQIIVRIKEAMVDVSTKCMELTMKERREVKLKVNEESKTKVEAQKKGRVKMLWRAFQSAFRVYTFSGEHDDRADKLSLELAQEIETGSQHQ